MKGDETAVEDAFCSWLVSCGWQANRQVDYVDVLATGPQGQRLFCEAKGSSPDIGTDCDVLYGQLLRRMTVTNDPTVRFAAVVRDDARSGRAVTRVPAEVRRYSRSTSTRSRTTAGCVNSRLARERAALPVRHSAARAAGSLSRGSRWSENDSGIEAVASLLTKVATAWEGS